MHVKQFIAIITLGVLCTGIGWAKKEAELKDLQNPGFVEQPEWFKTSFLDMRDDIAEAADQGRRLIFYFYQDGCPYCKKLLTVNFAQKTIVDMTRQNFDVVSVNMWGDREVTDFNGNILKEKDFAAQMRVMFTPTLLFFDEDGKVALRINGYFPPEKFMAALQYVAGKNEKKIRFSDYLEQINPPPSHGKLHSNPLFMKNPFDLTQRQPGKDFLLVLFEQKECPACDELHTDIFLRKESQELLTKFQIAQLDMWQKDALTTPAGEVTTIADWARSLNVKYAPSFVFFDAQGNEVIRMEAYLKAFHIQSVMDYVSSSAYRRQPSFQRYIDERAEALREKGIEINLME